MSRRSTLAPIIQSAGSMTEFKPKEEQPPSQEYTYDGKKKRKRFNEDYVEEAQQSVHQSSGIGSRGGLTAAKLHNLPEEGEGGIEKTGSSASRTTTFLRSLIKRVTTKPAEGEKSETASEYQKKVSNIIK